MSEAFRFQTLAYMALFTGLSLLILFIRLLPADLSGSGAVVPDLVFLMVAAWVLRRPVHLPALLIVAVAIVEDLLTQRPPGIWPLMMLAGSEFLRQRQGFAREINLAMEWAVVAGVYLGMFVLHRFALTIVMVPRPPLDLSLLALAVTVLLYPVVVFVLHFVFQVRKPATGEVDGRGRRL